MEPYQPVQQAYEAFARHAADSPCFQEWARGVADDAAVRELIGTLPQLKQQPNLVFAAARWHGAPAPGPYAGLREVLLQRWDAVTATVLARATQTNEVGRLATLLPAFAEIAEASGRPLALLEVGCSAGLCLHPDGYRYRWTTASGQVWRRERSGLVARAVKFVEIGDGPVLSCAVEGEVPLPATVPTIGWRGGIDLNPLSVADPDHMAWLEMLIWPEHDARRTRLREAIAVARRHHVEIVAGDLLAELPGLLDRIPDGLTPVVFHSAVIAYLPPGDRDRFAELMAGFVAAGRCHWVSNEASNVLPQVAAQLREPTPGTDFVLSVDGRPVGFAHSHGRTLTASASASA